MPRDRYFRAKMKMLYPLFWLQMLEKALYVRTFRARGLKSFTRLCAKLLLKRMILLVQALQILITKHLPPRASLRR